MEIWKDIKDYPNYQVSNLGNVRNKKTNRILKPWSPDKQYLKVKLSNNGVSKQFFVHRLVALAFIPNPNGLPEVNHKNEFEKTNNNVNNLEWCNHSYNQNYGTRNERVSKKVCKKINQYDLNGKYIKTFKSLAEASKEMGLTEAALSYAANGKRITSKGYVWRYVDE